MSNVSVRKYIFSGETVLLITGLVFFILAGLINVQNERPIMTLSKQDTAININKDLLIFVSAGNKRLLTDLLWVQTLIESDIEHYKEKDLNNWLFLRFNTIATLDPRFYENYFYGGQFLAIVKDDLEGADYLYEKGIKVFPEDYKLNFNAGFLNYYEMGNFKKGIKYLKKVEDHPDAPVFVRSIINKLLLATGVGLEEVFKLVLHHYETTKDDTLRSKLRRDLYAIKAEIDLTCLNNQRENCGRTDLNGEAYLQKGDKYFSPQTFLRYRIKKREAQGPLFPERINYIK